MKKTTNKNSKIPGISIVYYLITALYMSIGLILLFMNTYFAKLDFFKNSSQVNVATMALTLISIGLAMFGLGYSFYTNTKCKNEIISNNISSINKAKFDFSIKNVATSICLIISLCLISIFIGFWFYHDKLIDDNQLGYVGSIFGGGITLLGVCLTIHYEKITRKKDIATQYKPILIIDDNVLYILSNQDSKTIIEESDMVDILEYAKNQIRIESNIKIKNVGRGEAKNVSISSSFSLNDLNQKDSIEITPKCIDMIPIDYNTQVSSLLCFENIFKVPKNIGTIPVRNTKEMNVEYVLTYTDLYTLKNYKSVFCCKYIFEITNEQICITNKSNKNTFIEAREDNDND